MENKKHTSEELENKIFQLQKEINELRLIQNKNQIDDLKILIVDDEEIIVMLISIIVEKYSKEILIAKNGIDAVQICRNNPDIDLILMDIKMPEMDGYEATRQIRQFNKEVIIFAQTAFAVTGDKEIAIEAGCNDYVTKPFNDNSFTELINKYFNK